MPQWIGPADHNLRITTRLGIRRSLLPILKVPTPLKQSTDFGEVETLRKLVEQFRTAYFGDEG